MKVNVRNYDKIVVLNLIGPVVQADLITLIVELPKACKSAAHALVVLDQAQYDGAVGNLFVGWRDRRVPNGPKVVLVAANFARADAKDLPQAYEMINNAIADRLIQVHARDNELTKLREKKVQTERQLETLLALPAKHTQAEFNAAVFLLRDRHRNVKAMLQIFAGFREQAVKRVEVETDHTGQIAEIENRAFALMKKE